MSMLDSFFNKGFKAAKCKTLLKLTIPRIKLLRNKREIQIKQMRRDIAKLLETGQEATARIRVEHIIREENIMAAQEIIELFCELIAVRLPIIETQRECPLDLKEAISSVCFAAPRCADLPELLQVQILFASKYGKEFITAATELMPACGVNRQLIELLSIRAPSPEAKLKLLKEIAEEHELDWDPAASETELLKKHEDLLNGPTHITMLPLQTEKHDAVSNSAPDLAKHEQPDSDTDLATLDFPEVPKVSLRPNTNASLAPEIDPPVQTAPHSNVDRESSNHFVASKDLSQESHFEHDVIEEKSMATKDEISSTVVGAREEKQFLPFISPPSLSSASFSAAPSPLPTSGIRNKSDAYMDLQNASAAVQGATETAKYASISCTSQPSVMRTKSEAYVDLQKASAAGQGAVETAKHTTIPSTSPPSMMRAINEANVDLQDVLAAAHTAAETAERAAAAARSAATLAQARISELTKRNSEKFPESSSDNPFYMDTLYLSASTEKPHFVHQQSFGETDNFRAYEVSPQLHDSRLASELPDIPSFEKLKVNYDSPRDDQVLEQSSVRHQPQRLPSMDDEPYFSYPNLFMSQNSNLGSSAQSVTDHSRSTHDI